MTEFGILIEVHGADPKHILSLPDQLYHLTGLVAITMLEQKYGNAYQVLSFDNEANALNALNHARMAIMWKTGPYRVLWLQAKSTIPRSTERSSSRILETAADSHADNVPIDQIRAAGQSNFGGYEDKRSLPLADLQRSAPSAPSKPTSNPTQEVSEGPSQQNLINRVKDYIKSVREEQEHQVKTQPSADSGAVTDTISSQTASTSKKVKGVPTYTAILKMNALHQARRQDEATASKQPQGLCQARHLSCSEDALAVTKPTQSRSRLSLDAEAATEKLVNALISSHEHLQKALDEVAAKTNLVASRAQSRFSATPDLNSRRKSSPDLTQSQSPDGYTSIEHDIRSREEKRSREIPPEGEDTSATVRLSKLKTDTATEPANPPSRSTNRQNPPDRKEEPHPLSTPVFTPPTPSDEQLLPETAEDHTDEGNNITPQPDSPKVMPVSEAGELARQATSLQLARQTPDASSSGSVPAHGRTSPQGRTSPASVDTLVETDQKAKKKKKKKKKNKKKKDKSDNTTDIGMNDGASASGTASHIEDVHAQATNQNSNSTGNVSHAPTQGSRYALAGSSEEPVPGLRPLEPNDYHEACVPTSPPKSGPVSSAFSNQFKEIAQQKKCLEHKEGCNCAQKTASETTQPNQGSPKQQSSSFSRGKGKSIKLPAYDADKPPSYENSDPLREGSKYDLDTEIQSYYSYKEKPGGYIDLLRQAAGPPELWIRSDSSSNATEPTQRQPGPSMDEFVSPHNAAAHSGMSGHTGERVSDLTDSSSTGNASSAHHETNPMSKGKGKEKALMD